MERRNLVAGISAGIAGTSKLPNRVRALELLQMVYRGEFNASPEQMRAAIEALPYETPKLTAVAVGHLTGEDFYNRLERAVNRTNAKLIEGSVVQVDEHD